ncbi:MAG: hypothetical protein M9904_14555 [Chitinophagaceae bacterium]|nr:hypothetical protein [Chitinophagaceae bacterium]MCO5241268.1 hypothetical protein [Chitinophagaceae bacterium]
MKGVFLLLICTFFLSGTCQKEKGHFIIVLKNLSGHDIILSEKATYQGKCLLTGETLAKDTVIHYRPFNTSIESNLSNERPMEIYWVDVNRFNHGDFYNCDSIYIKNNILKKYTLTLDTLIQTNFTIVYQ